MTAPSAPEAAVFASELPLVSVLIRSIDRALLAEALASVAAQTYPHVEIIVVAALPGHGALPFVDGTRPVRLLQAAERRPRSLAANVALDAAAGDWLLFLDDDDWLLPEHITRLVAAVQAHPQSLAAYAGVAMVDADGTPQGQAFDLPFDAVRLMAGNLTPIHAVLFSRQLLARGCRFDEALDRYEDWDFWLQVARHTVPVHVPGVSAVYRIHGSSGVHEDVGAEGLSSHAIHAKWLLQSNPRQLGEVMQRVWAYDVMVQRLALVERVAEAREVALADAIKAVRDQVTSLQALHALHDLLQKDVQEAARVTEQRHAAAEEKLRGLVRQSIEQSHAQLTAHLTEHLTAQLTAQLTAHLTERLEEQLNARWSVQLERERARGERLERDLAEERLRATEQRFAHEALRASFSWRLTWPLRAAIDVVRRTLHRTRH